MNEHLFQFLLVLAGVILGAIVGAVPGAIRGWKKDLIADGAKKQLELSRDAALANEAKERGKLEARLEGLEQDIQGVADMARARFAKLEKKDTAIETLVTGKMPRVSGENEAVASART